MIDFAGPWAVFQDVMLDTPGADHADRMPFRLYTVGDSRAPVRVTGGMTVVPDYTFDEAPAPKVVVVGAQRGSPAMQKWLQTGVKRQRGLRFVQSSDRIFTAGGLTSGIDLALHIVARYYGEAVAARTAEYMEYDTGRRQGRGSQ
jgi:transcriptional regulator GlxA family with amidase domain